MDRAEDSKKLTNTTKIFLTIKGDILEQCLLFKIFKKISTHLLTRLIIGDIVQIEQMKRDKKKEEKFRRSQIQWSKQTTLRILRMCRIYQMRDDSHLYR